MPPLGIASSFGSAGCGSLDSMRKVEDMDQSNEPLARRLRDAAIDRTTTDAERVDSFVLDADGVIDLRDLEHDPLGSSVADPAKVLATIRGQLGDAHEVSDLYDQSEPERPRWRLGLRARHAYGNDVPSAMPTPTASTTTVASPPAPPIAAPASVAMPEPATLPPLSRLSMVPLTIEETPTPATDAPTSDVDEVSVATTASPPVAESVDPDIDLRSEDRPIANCPKCMGLGHRDLFDRFSQVEFYSCDNCMHMWQQDLS